MEGILIIRQPITHEEFEAMYDLRWRILRAPWNQPKGSERDEWETKASHFIALLNDKIIGTARLQLINQDAKIGQVRYLAIETIFQRKGIGGKLIEAIHLTATNRFLNHLVLNAREHAVKFFEKHGYKVVGEGPLLF
ncbi:MAG TPA: GNAT family N-acetyltransferase, partial [Candidatus Deferrimicrobium sp.]|nr:GNAT family N-acetyltransferase [Candidatus Deferrimicrobium sp.]